MRQTIARLIKKNTMANRKNSKKYEEMEQTAEQLRTLPIPEALMYLDLYAKVDRSYRPRNDAKERRLHVSLKSGEVIELLLTGEKWYDKRAEKGGGGAIDLVMHLYEEGFPQAVQRLQRAVADEALDDVQKSSAEAEFPTRLAPVRQPESQFFVADILDWLPKDDTASMEHPLFALKAGDKRMRVYERNGNRVIVKPGYDGLATIHDKDLWIYCISQLVAAKNQGREIERTVRFTMYDFLTSTNRPTSGVGYQRAADALRRLKETTIETNIKTASVREQRGFGLIDSWRVIERDGDSRMASVEVTLSDWLFRSVDSLSVLTLSYDYFRLRRALDRRIYELARKHCGQQPTWQVSVSTLHQKSGSSAALKKFRFELRALVASGELPDYLVTYDAETDVATFRRKTLLLNDDS